MAIHPSAATGFERAAEVYERSRPGYPPDAVGFIADRLALGPGRTVLDLAAGTGKLTTALLETGATVLAVEPVRAMRERLPSEATALQGTAQALPVPDEAVDGLTVAQAFHWFAGEEALREMWRVLRPGRGVALIWNWRPSADPVHAAIDQLLEPHRGDAPSGGDGRWREPLNKTDLFDLVETAEFAHAQRFDADGLRDRVASTSFVASLPDVERNPLLERIGALAGGARVTLTYRTEVILLTRRDRPG